MNIVEFQKKYDSDWLDKDGYLVDFNLGLPENVVLKSKKDYETLRMEYNKTNECDSIQGRLDFCTKYNINIDGFNMMLLYLENDKRNYFSFFQAIALNLTNNLSFEEFFKKYTNSNLTLELLINKLNDDNCKYKLLKNFLDYLIRNKYYLNLNFIKYFLNLDDCLSFYKFDSIFKDFALKHISKKEDKQEFSHEFIHFSFINYMIPFSPKNGIFHYQYKGVSLDVDEKITNLILYYISKNYIYKCDYTFNGLLKKFIEIGLLVDFTYFSYDYRKDNGNDSLYRAIFISDYIHRVKEEVKKTKDKQKKLGVMPNSQF